MNETAKKIIKALDLAPLEMEGGYFRRTHTSSQTTTFNIRSKIEERPNASAIFYLLTSDTYSKIHRLPTDEVYHFYLGDPVELLLLEGQGQAKVVELGNDILNNQQLQFVVNRGTWQGSRLKSGGTFALLGTTMAPAFEYSDFELPKEEALLFNTYPEPFHDLIKALL